MSDKELLENILKSIEIQENLTDEKISSDAIEEIIGMKKILPVRFLYYRNLEKKLYFMAGSPGAGKSETALFLKEKNKIDVIDTDELRKVFTNYNGKNSNLFQKASSKGVNFLVDFSFKNGLSFILDGNFSNYKMQEQNIQRALKREYHIEINFIYRSFDKAKVYTKVREEKTGRKVPDDVFINKTVDSYETVQKFFGQIPVNFYDLDNQKIIYDISKEEFVNILHSEIEMLKSNGSKD